MFFKKRKTSEDFYDMFSQAGQNLLTAAGYLEQIVNAPQAVAETMTSEQPEQIEQLAKTLQTNPESEDYFQVKIDGQKVPVKTSLVRKDRKHYRELLHEIEHENDQVTHRVANLLDATFVTPMDREDISLLSAVLDDCMDYLDEAGDLILLYRLQDLPKRLATQVKILAECAQLTAEAMPKLRQKANLKEYTVAINALENKGDKAYRKMLVELFDSGLDPIEIIKIKDILECMENCCDAFERLANVVEAIYIKES